MSTKANISTIFDTINLIEGFNWANIMLPNETIFHINNALYNSKFRRNFLNFKDTHRKKNHIKTINKGNV